MNSLQSGGFEKRRSFSRVCICLEAEVATEGATFATQSMRDLSMNGLFLLGETRLAEGTPCQTTIFLGDRQSGQCIKAAGVVARVTGDGTGIEFQEIAGLESYHHLRNLVLHNSDDSQQVRRELDSHLGIKRQ